MHGAVGEDGTIRGILEVRQIPYTHSGVLASALAPEKDPAKTNMAAAGIPVDHGVTVPRVEASRRHILPPPYVVNRSTRGCPSVSSSPRKSAHIRHNC
jgi:D-alanine-D-alanine ligase